MTQPLAEPKLNNPLAKTRQPVLPPWRRSRVALGLTAAAALGRFELQRCDDCLRVQYPPREMCDGCLSSALRWVLQEGRGELLASTQVEHSADLYFREHLPWRVGLVKLFSGPTVVAHLHGDIGTAGAVVRVIARLDRAGRGVLIAVPEQDVANMADDKQLREMSCDPKFRCVLVTDGTSPVGQALVRALIGAGAKRIWVGHAEPWKDTAVLKALTDLEQVTLVPLDLTDARSVTELAGSIGGRVDILINSCEVHRAHSIASRKGIDVAKLEMDVNYFGLLRLAQAFAPAMKARAADGEDSAVAWVNLLSVFALSSFPEQGTFSASKAAAYSLSQALRADLQANAIRVVNVFPGPIDDEWNQLLPPPKLAPQRLARDIVGALCEGVEDVYPGDVAQEYLQRWLENPKVLERELAE